MNESTDESGNIDHINRDVLEDTLRSLQGDINSKAPSFMMKVFYAAGIVAIVLTCLAYIVGRRAGRKRSTIVEIKRL